jgi:hypothetical protein
VSVRYLFEHGLKPGGVYIVEDTEMNYWRKGETYGNPTNYGKDHADSLITKFKAFVDVVRALYLVCYLLSAVCGLLAVITPVLGAVPVRRRAPLHSPATPILLHARVHHPSSCHLPTPG